MNAYICGHKKNVIEPKRRNRMSHLRFNQSSSPTKLDSRNKNRCGKIDTYTPQYSMNAQRERERLCKVIVIVAVLVNSFIISFVL